MSLTGAKIGNSLQTAKHFCRNLCQTPANFQFRATMSKTAFRFSQSVTSRSDLVVTALIYSFSCINDLMTLSMATTE
jgi:hypothetical protein